MTPDHTHPPPLSRKPAIQHVTVGNFKFGDLAGSPDRCLQGNRGNACEDTKGSPYVIEPNSDLLAPHSRSGNKSNIVHEEDSVSGSWCYRKQLTKNS